VQTLIQHLKKLKSTNNKKVLKKSLQIIKVVVKCLLLPILGVGRHLDFDLALGIRQIL